jgi:hypothetical protein
MSLFGNLKVLPGQRCFSDTTGAPAFFLGDTQWELFRLLTTDESLHILQDRRAKGFNAILVMLLGVETSVFSQDGLSGHVNLEGESPWIDGDPLQPNERYFRRIDPIIRLGEQTGQTLIVGVYHQWHVDRIPLSKARPWARWVAQRYRDVPNLAWSMYPRAEASYIPVCRELAAGLQEGDGGAHLISLHPDPSVASSSFLHMEPWLAFNMIQTCIDYDQVGPAVAADYARLPVKPVVMAEGGYEGLEFGKLQGAHEIRKQAYWTQLAGGYHVYGHNEAWQFPRQWGRWLDAPGSQQLAIFKQILSGLERWWELVPDPSLIVEGAGGGFAWNAAARSSSGDWLLAYLSEPSSIRLRLDALSPAPHAQASWIDPRSGDRLPGGEYPTTGIQPFRTPPGWEDALLWVKVES